MTPRGDQRVRNLRLDRRALRAEQARVGWWRRLVKARMDLLVAGAARPAPLGEDVAFQLPLDVTLGAPQPVELDRLLPGRSDLAQLTDLRALDERLAEYERGVARALAQTTERLIDRLAGNPSGTREMLGEPLGQV